MRLDYFICDQQKVKTLENAYYWSNLYSPNYPDEYNNLDDCGLQIYSPNGVVILEIVHFDLNGGYDKLLVYDGADKQSRLLATYTGKNESGYVVSSGEHLYIKYNSGIGFPNSRFHLRFTSGWSIIKFVVGLYISIPREFYCL